MESLVAIIHTYCVKYNTKHNILYNSQYSHCGQLGNKTIILLR